MTPLLVSLAFGLAIAAPFVCVAWWASRMHTRQVAHYECRLHALARDCALKQEQLDRVNRAQEAAWARECEQFWAANDAASPDAQRGGAA